MRSNLRRPFIKLGILFITQLPFKPIDSRPLSSLVSRQRQLQLHSDNYTTLHYTSLNARGSRGMFARGRHSAPPTPAAARATLPPALRQTKGKSTPTSPVPFIRVFGVYFCLAATFPNSFQCPRRLIDASVISRAKRMLLRGCSLRVRGTLACYEKWVQSNLGNVRLE